MRSAAENAGKDLQLPQSLSPCFADVHTSDSIIYSPSEVHISNRLVNRHLQLLKRHTLPFEIAVSDLQIMRARFRDVLELLVTLGTVLSP